MADIRVTSFSRESASMEDVLINMVGADHAELAWRVIDAGVLAFGVVVLLGGLAMLTQMPVQ